MYKILTIQWLLGCITFLATAQTQNDSSLLTIDRIFNSSEFRRESAPDIKWIRGGEAYIVREPAADNKSREDLVKYETKNLLRSLYIAAENLIPPGDSTPLTVEEFTLSPDESKVLIFTNTSRVWRSNSKGDYWVYDLTAR